MATEIIGFRFTIEYKPGKNNVVTDALSRPFFIAVSSSIFSILEEIKIAVEKDDELKQISKGCIVEPAKQSLYIVRNGVLCRRDRIVIPATAKDIQEK